MGLIGNLLVNVFALFVVSYIIPGFVINDFTTAIVVAVVFGVINTFVKPLLKIITLPLTFLTLDMTEPINFSSPQTMCGWKSDTQSCASPTYQNALIAFIPIHCSGLLRIFKQLKTIKLICVRLRSCSL